MKKQIHATRVFIGTFFSIILFTKSAEAQYDKKGWPPKEDFAAQQSSQGALSSGVDIFTQTQSIVSIGYATGGSPGTGAGTGGATNLQCPPGHSLAYDSFGRTSCVAGAGNTNPQCGQGFEQIFDQYGRPTCVRVVFDQASCRSNFHSTFSHLYNTNNLGSVIEAFMDEYNMSTRISNTDADIYAQFIGIPVNEQDPVHVKESKRKTARHSISQGCYRNALAASLIINENVRRECYNDIKTWFSHSANNMNSCPNYDEVF